jgi:hypothetical protein
MTKIKQEQIIEGNLMVEKDTSDFGGLNMWHLHIKTIDGYWENVQWMSIYNVQKFFKTKLTVYKE